MNSATERKLDWRCTLLPLDGEAASHWGQLPRSTFNCHPCWLVEHVSAGAQRHAQKHITCQNCDYGLLRQGKQTSMWKGFISVAINSRQRSKTVTITSNISSILRERMITHERLTSTHNKSKFYWAYNRFCHLLVLFPEEILQFSTQRQ